MTVRPELVADTPSGQLPQKAERWGQLHPAVVPQMVSLLTGNAGKTLNVRSAISDNIQPKIEALQPIRGSVVNRFERQIGDNHA